MKSGSGWAEMWTPPPPAQPPPGWWTLLETAEEWETRRWIERIREERRAAVGPVLDRPEWRLPALQARVSRLDRTIRDVLAKSEERSR
jgi:hypothetical protein